MQEAKARVPSSRAPLLLTKVPHHQSLQKGGNSKENHNQREMGLL